MSHQTRRWLLPVLMTFAVAIAGLAMMQGTSREVVAAPVVPASSCQGAFACEGLGDQTVIGENSCNGTSACQAFSGRIGDNSCNETSACQATDGTIGDDSCNGVSACGAMRSNIGDHSCNALSACQDGSGDIGDFSCNGQSNCQQLDDDVGFCEENDPQIDCPRPTPAPRQQPNIGAGLSGLFAGQPTPLPTAPSAVAPAANAPSISPPRTGDAGLVNGGNTTAVTLGLLVVVSAGLVIGLRVVRTR